DMLLRTSKTRDVGEQPVVAILIDDEAVERYGPLPWSRSRLTDLVDSSAASGARGIALDLILAESTEPETDRELAEGLAGIPVAIAAAFDRDGSWLLPNESLGGAADAAHAYGEVGPDGVVRTIAATKQGHGLSLPALSLAAARFLRPELPIEPGASLRPEFRPAPQHIPTLSAASLLDGSYDPEVIAGRVVFVGISATGAGDQFVVPTGPRHQPVPGVLAHASATVSILRGRLLRVPSWGWSLVAALTLALGVQWIRDLRGAFDLAAFAAIAFGIALLAVTALRLGLLLIPATSLLIAAVVSALLRETVESWAARKESGLLLSAVLEHVGAAPSPVPNTAAGRLDALRRVQERVLDEDATRRALLDGMDEGVVLWDRDGRTILSNPAAKRLWGGVPGFEEIVENTETAEPIVVSRGTRELAVAITDLGRGHLAILRDITAERDLERRRREMQRLVSHELKTPLSSIAGFGESLERYELDRGEQRRVAALIRGEAQRLQEMVTVFLDLERLGGGHWEGAIEPVDLGLRVASRLEVLSAAAERRNIRLSRSIGEGHRVSAVPSLLDRVVDNLVGNAIKYTDVGEEIVVEVFRSANQVFLVVSDHGPGIPEDGLARIFDRFYRVPGTKETGAGLGLALVKEVIDWHGGCITIDSKVGVGSAFKVSLPVFEEV
ncbi:MAG: CHASE2 and HATPase_c domain-containing protein, partial [Thermoanaerobaculales bacterium]|nr:CHASE2 and HATPase_c domain-containing protein [Thermoanaerobaculales bacterium]